MSIPQSLRDPKLRISPSLYTLCCLPIRFILGLCLILFPTHIVTSLSIVISLFAVAGLGYKRFVNPRSWKHYYRSITTYIIVCFMLIISLVCQKTELCAYAGILIIVDALIGKQSQYEAQVLTSVAWRRDFTQIGERVITIWILMNLTQVHQLLFFLLVATRVIWVLCWLLSWSIADTYAIVKLWKPTRPPEITCRFWTKTGARIHNFILKHVTVGKYSYIVF